MKDSVINSLTKAEQDAQTIRQRDEQIKRMHGELLEFIQVEKVIVAAGKISEATIRQAHKLVQNLK